MATERASQSHDRRRNRLTFDPLTLAAKPAVRFDSTQPQDPKKTDQEPQAIFVAGDKPSPSADVTEANSSSTTVLKQEPESPTDINDKPPVSTDPLNKTSTDPIHPELLLNHGYVVVLEKQAPPAEIQPVNDSPGSGLLTFTGEEKAPADAESSDPPRLPKDNATIIFVGNTRAGGMQEPTSKDSQDEDGEDDDKYIPPTAGEIEAYNLKRQARLQVALNLLRDFKNGKLKTLDRDPTAYIQSIVPPEISNPDAKTFLPESLDEGLKYWNNNEWEFRNDLTLQQLAEICLDLRNSRSRPRYTPETAKQQILAHFNLI